MAESTENISINELQACFNDLKMHSVSHKLGQAQPTAGDEMQNPLHKQFSLILTKIEELLAKESKDSEDYLRIVSMKASIIYEKAKILLSENLLSVSQELLEQALDIIKDYEEHPKVAFLRMRVVNHLTYVLSRLGNLDEAKELLTKAIIDEKKCSPEVFSTDDLFLNTKKDDKVSTSKLNRLTINNMQMLAWIYARLGDSEKNLKLHHDILQKQLDIAEMDVIKWAESCFRLAGMFVGQQDWKNAEYHLLAAEEVLNPLEVSLVPNPEVYLAQADLARSWVYYGLQLFEASRKCKIPNDIENEDLSKPIQQNDKSNLEQFEVCNFNGLSVNIANYIPTSRIENLDQAKILFAHLQIRVKRARLFYTLRDYPLQYVNLCLDLSELYRYLALYEEDLDSQYAVQKRRYEALETLSNILKEVRPSCYVAVNVELTKELIEVQMELMNLNLKKLYSPNETLRNSEDTLRRQLNAFASFQGKLETVSSAISTRACHPSREKDEKTHLINDEPPVTQEKAEEDSVIKTPNEIKNDLE